MSYDGAANFPAASKALPVVLCPADAVTPRVPGSPYGATNYAANAGTTGSLTAADGVFFTGSAVRLTDIRAGASNVAFFGERLLGDGPGGADPRRGFVELPGATDPTPAACAAATPTNRERGAKWVFGNLANTLYTHTVPPNAADPDCTNAAQQRGRTAAGSGHPGGVNTAFGDGGVRFVGGDVDAAVWLAMGRRE